MVYINYPRVDLDVHADLATWRAKAAKAEGDWTSLKGFLAAQPRSNDRHPLPKCWYTELPQGDNYALDVEHYRPKNQAAPLTKRHLRALEKIVGYKIQQFENQGAYPWLEFDYRNYRLVTALPNRGGAKHIYFPVADGSARLSTGTFPWVDSEYNLLLDPADPHDPTLLFVQKDGIIVPRAPKTPLTPQDFADFENIWRNEGFNYLRAAISIFLYRLDDPVLTQARKVIYEDTQEILWTTATLVATNGNAAVIKKNMEKLFIQLLPSAPFALAARCGLIAFQDADRDIQNVADVIIKSMNQRINDLSASQGIDWLRP